MQITDSYLSLVRQATHSHHHRTQIGNALLARGHSINGSLTKIYRKAHE